jgi:hypothetical protein
MHKLTALVEHLLAVTALPREQMHAYADRGELQPSGRDLGLTADGLPQIEAGVWRYDALVRMERYKGDGPQLMAVVLGWLADNDPHRDGLAEAEADVHINDNDTCDVELACEFEERLVMVEAPDGPIPFNGRRWRMAAPQIRVARTVQPRG